MVRPRKASSETRRSSFTMLNSADYGSLTPRRRGIASPHFPGGHRMGIDRVRAAFVWLAVVFVLGMGSDALAQTGAASITGLVTDESGAVTPGVTVTATNQATNVAYTGLSNESGSYTITSLPVGTYVVRSSLGGFKTYS